MTRLGEVLTADEHVVPLKSRRAELERDAMRLLATAAPVPFRSSTCRASLGPGGSQRAPDRRGTLANATAISGGAATSLKAVARRRYRP